LVYAVSGLTPEQTRGRPGPGAWSIAELVAHLSDADLVGSDRMKRVIAEETPVLQAFDENAWISRLRSDELPVAESADLFAANRRAMSRILRNCQEADFARAGTHTERGRMTLAELVSSFVGHLDHHLKFLYAKRANLGLSVYPRYSRDEPYL